MHHADRRERQGVPAHGAVAADRADQQDRASGYMAMRWNQHSRHGAKWATSEK